MTMAIVGGSAEGGVEADIGQNTFMKSYQRSSCYGF